MNEAALLRRDGGRVADERSPADVPPHESPIRRKRGGRGLAQSRKQALNATRNVVADGSVAGRLQAREAVEMIAFGIGELQSAGQRGHDLTRWRRGPALLKPDDVVDRDARETGKLFAAKADRAARPPRRQTYVGGGKTIAPHPDRRSETGVLGCHRTHCGRLIAFADRRSWYCWSYPRAVSGYGVDRERYSST